MNQMLGMNPEEVRAKAAILRTQLSVLASAADTVNAAALSSLNPLSYGIQPGGLVIAPFAIGGTQAAAALVRAASGSVMELAGKLLEEAYQQEVVSGAADRSYRGGAVPPVSEVSKSPAGEFWQGLLGDSVGNWADALNGAASLAFGVGDMLAEGFKVTGKLAGFLRVAGGVFAGLEVVTGVYDAVVGFTEGDNYAGADGVISAAIGVAGVVGAIALAGTPVGWVIAGVGLAWGAAKVFSGDVPVSKRVMDFAGDTVGVVSEGLAGAASGVSGFVDRLTSPLGSLLG